VHISGKLIRDMKHGSEKAFTTIYEHYHKLIYYIVFQYVKDVEVAKDLTQDAFIKMYNEVRKNDEPIHFHPWFIALTKNIVFDYFRQNKLNRVDKNSEKTLAEFPDPSYQASPGSISFQSLTPIEKQVIDYKIIFKQTFKEIAETMGLSLSVVTKIYYEALNKLRLDMEDKSI